jgi:hypothetical protein
MRIQDSHSPELGEILVSLTYLPSARRLNLDLLRGKQLLQTNFGGSGELPICFIVYIVHDRPTITKVDAGQALTIGLIAEILKLQQFAPFRLLRSL